MEDWDSKEVAKLPDHIKPFFADRNTRHWKPEAGNKPADMATESPGMNPSRWQRS